jgi:hypothetical protein
MELLGRGDMRNGMITAAEIWAAIDTLAASRDLSLSDLAVRAGLPESALQAESRFSQPGELSWPAFPELLQLVSAAGVTLREFGEVVDDLKRKSDERGGA